MSADFLIVQNSGLGCEISGSDNNKTKIVCSKTASKTNQPICRTGQPAQTSCQSLHSILSIEDFQMPQSVLIIGIFPRDPKFQTQNKYFAFRLLSQSTHNFVFIYFFVNKYYVFCLHYMPDKRRLVTSNICFGSKIAGLLESFL